MKKIFNQKGSLLLEVLLATAIGAIIIGAVSELVYVSSKSGQVSGAKSSAISLAEEGLEAAQSISETDWHDIYLPPFPSTKGSDTEYYIYNDGVSWLLTGTDTSKRDIEIDGIIYTRKIYINNVERQKTGDRKICSEKEISESADGCLEGDFTEDPSTQKIKVVVSKSGSTDVALEEYLTRWKNETTSQNDWSVAKPATEADCQNAGGTWDAFSFQCYAVYPGNKENWKAYDEILGDNIDAGTAGVIKLKPL